MQPAASLLLNKEKNKQKNDKYEKSENYPTAREGSLMGVGKYNRLAE